MTTQTTTPASVSELFTMEPRLKSVSDLATASRGNRWQRYSQAKVAADGYVGWGAENPALRNDRAYNLFISHLVELLKI